MLVVPTAESRISLGALADERQPLGERRAGDDLREFFQEHQAAVDRVI
jgi:hypothetical protein